MIKVAITAAGGGVGQSIIKSLKDTEYQAVAIDPDPRAAGLYMADEGRLGPKLNDPDFVNKLIQICTEEGCKYLFSGFDAELPILSAAKEKFRAAGIVPIISDPNVVELSDSKWALVEFLKVKGFPYIPSWVESGDFPKDFPRAIAKPVRGCRSQGIREVYNAYLAKELLETAAGTYLIQEYINGPEYTCGTVSFDSRVLGVICMERELRNGDTYKAKVNQNPVVLEFVHNLISRIKPFGPCNVQLRLREEEGKQVPYVLEINARCSGTTAARTLAGFNEPKIILDYLEGKEIKFKIEDGLEIYRYWEEIVVRPKDKVQK